MSQRTPAAPQSVDLPPEVLPRDGRFGSGPSRIRPAQLEALAAAGDRLGTSHRQAPVKQVVAELRAGLADFFALPAGYEIVLGNGGASAFWDVATACLVRRRAQQDVEKERKFGVERFARDVLSVADNLDRALAAIPASLREDEKFKGLVTGLEATGRELANVFGRHGLTKIEALGQPLDPNKHQAMMEVPSADAEPGTILVEMQAGYMIKDRLLRPAMVSVAKKPD